MSREALLKGKPPSTSLFSSAAFILKILFIVYGATTFIITILSIMVECCYAVPLMLSVDYAECRYAE
jgi:hypothetical protein